jgi:hypothetical protein
LDIGKQDYKTPLKIYQRLEKIERYMDKRFDWDGAVKQEEPKKGLKKLGTKKNNALSPEDSK